MNTMQNFKTTSRVSGSTSTTGVVAQTRAQSLHEQFIRLGLQRNKITYQLLALLPEIYKQEIYKEKGYATIFEYAGRLAGLSRLVVEKTLRVAHRLEDKPHLQAAVKTEGIHKVAVVAVLATPETEKAWADKVCNMSLSGLGELAKEVRQNVPKHGRVANIFVANLQSTPCRAAPQKINIELDAEMQFLFLQLKNELEKKTRQKFSNKEAFRQVLIEQSALMKQRVGVGVGVGGAVRIGAGIQAGATKSKPQTPEISKFFIDEKIAKNEKSGGGGRKFAYADEATLAKMQKSGVKGQSAKNTDKCVTRYIPAEQKRTALQKTADHCGYPGCAKPVELFHHRERFSENKSHNSIIPLCKEHHEFMHNGLIENETGAPENWKLRIQEFPRKTADLFFRKYRKAASSP